MRVGIYIPSKWRDGSVFVVHSYYLDAFVRLDLN